MLQFPEDSAKDSLRELVERACNGDEQAFADLFNYYSFALERYVLGLVGNAHDAEDLVQKTFIKAWNKLPSLRNSAGFKAWLFRIATNEFKDWKRTRRRVETTTLEDGDLHVGSGPPLDEAVAERELTMEALQMLKAKYRKCLLLELEGKLNHEEIANVLDIKQKSVKTYISKARRDLRQAYHKLSQEH
jgi:RNA polymerase sigma-70 factor (ECF subfamily)